MTADGLIDWTTLTAGTTMNLRSIGATIDVPSVTSGGTQTLRAAQDVTFNQITTNGITGDPGDVQRHLGQRGDRRRRNQRQRLDHPDRSDHDHRHDGDGRRRARWRCWRTA